MFKLFVYIEDYNAYDFVGNFDSESDALDYVYEYDIENYSIVEEK